MFKFILFPLLWFLTGNFVAALLLLLVILYIVDRRFIGLAPNIWRPFQLSRRASKAKQDIQSNPHHTSMKLELARILIEKKKFQKAIPYLEEILVIMGESAEVRYELGLCYLKLNDLAQGEKYMQEAMELNPRVKFGEGYLRLGEAFATRHPDKAIVYIGQFRATHSSSCEANYRLGEIFRKLDRYQDAKQAYTEAIAVYRCLPRYSRKQQRRWVIMATSKKIMV